MLGRIFSGYWTRWKQERTQSQHNLDKNSKELEDNKSGNNNHIRKRKLDSNRKRGFEKTPVKSAPNFEFETSDSSEEETEYDVKRKRALEEREKMLRDIGVTIAKEKVKEIIDQTEEVNKERRGIRKFYTFHIRKPQIPVHHQPQRLLSPAVLLHHATNASFCHFATVLLAAAAAFACVSSIAVEPPWHPLCSVPQQQTAFGLAFTVLKKMCLC